jgi:hypothetical protein
MVGARNMLCAISHDRQTRAWPVYRSMRQACFSSRQEARPCYPEQPDWLETLRETLRSHVHALSGTALDVAVVYWVPPGRGVPTIRMPRTANLAAILCLGGSLTVTCAGRAADVSAVVCHNTALVVHDINATQCTIPPKTSDRCPGGKSIAREGCYCIAMFSSPSA